MTVIPEYHDIAKAKPWRNGRGPNGACWQKEMANTVNQGTRNRLKTMNASVRDAIVPNTPNKRACPIAPKSKLQLATLRLLSTREAFYSDRGAALASARIVPANSSVSKK